MKRRWRIVTGGGAAFLLMSAALVHPAVAGDQGKAPVAKGTDPTTWSLPVDVTGDAAASDERARLLALLAPLKALDGGMIWDGSTQTLTVQMTTDAAIEQAQQLIAKAATSMRIRFLKVQYTQQDLDELATRLLGDQTAWAGASGIGGGYDPKANRVLLQVDANYKDAKVLIAAIKNLNDPRVILQVLQDMGGGVESRVADFAPWSVGAKIDGTTYGCTLGWTWKLWSNSQVVGSTARHCTDLSWYNNGVYVGTVFQSKKSADSAFMQGSSYSASVFVGNQTTSDIRPVVAIDTSWSVGDSVAMSGATTGLNVSTVQIPSYTLPSCMPTDVQGLTGVLMATHITAGGDSGGPWLTTQSGTGYAVAHGQHLGFGCLAGYTGSFFIKLNSISAAQQASIVLQ